MSDACTFCLVGHCGFDRMGLSRAVKKAVRGATIVTADEPGSLVPGPVPTVFLVNRQPGGAFGGAGGLDLVRQIAADGGVAVLVSNFDSAQAAAEEVGAFPGFGKGGLRDLSTVERLQAAAAAARERAGR